MCSNIFSNVVECGKIGDCISIRTESENFVCSLNLELLQSFDRRELSVVKMDNYVSFGNSFNTNITRLISKIDVKNVVFLETKKVENVKLVAVYKNDLYRMKNLKGNCKWLRYILKRRLLISECLLNCQDHPLAKLMGLEFVKIEINGLLTNQVTKITSNTGIEIVDEMELDYFNERLNMSKTPQKFSEHSERVERNIISLLTTIFQRGITYCPIGFRGVKGFVVVDPYNFHLDQIISRCVYKYGAMKFVIRRTDILGDSIDESEVLLKAKLSKALEWSSKGPIALILPDMDTIFTNSRSQFALSKRLLTIFLQFLDEEIGVNIVVIGTLRSIKDIEPSILRHGRLDKKVVIGGLSYTERLDILKNLCKKHLAEEVNIELIAEKTPGYGASDLLNLWQNIVFLHCQDKNVLNISDKIKLENVSKALLEVKTAAYKSTSDWRIQLMPVNWEDIVGMEKIKKRIKMAVEWPLMYSKSFERLGLKQPRGVLLFGPPGCCKTTLVRGVASMCKTTFLSASPAQIFSPFVGESSKTISEIFEAARSATPAIVFFDEIDSLVGSREFGSKYNSIQTGVQEQVLSALLNEMDGFGASSEGKDNVIVIGVTNRFDLLDAALLRPGRFDSIVYVGQPDLAERKDILKHILGKLPTKDVNVEYLAEETEFFSGADLKNLCQEAALNAMDENINCVDLNSSHFNHALKVVKPSLTKQQLDWFDKICKKYNIPND